MSEEEIRTVDTIGEALQILGGEHASTEYGWVIEAPSNPPMRAIVYWDGGDWSSNNMRAVRFSRQVDAERVMINLPSDKGLTGMKAIEHGWG